MRVEHFKRAARFSEARGSSAFALMAEGRIARELKGLRWRIIGCSLGRERLPFSGIETVVRENLGGLFRDSENSKRATDAKGITGLENGYS